MKAPSLSLDAGDGGAVGHTGGATEQDLGVLQGAVSLLCPRGCGGRRPAVTSVAVAWLPSVPGESTERTLIMTTSTADGTPLVRE